MLKHPENYPYQVIKERIEGISIEGTRACIAMLYATGCRVSELLKIEAENVRKETDRQGREIVRVYAPVLKKREPDDRFIAISLKDEGWLAEIVFNYAFGKHGQLFQKSRATIWRWCKEFDNEINPHGWRKIRASHLVTVFGYNGHQLKAFFNWARLSSSEPYVKMNLEDITPVFK